MRNLKIFLLIFILLVSVLYGQTDSSLTFSEVMYYPASAISNGEFIELFNSSFKDTIDLKNYKIKYYTSNPDTLTDAGFGTKLLPRTFCIILEKDYAGGYSISPSALTMKIHDNSFGTSGMSNSESRELKLVNSRGDTVSRYSYSVPNNAGYSDEKKVLNNDNSSYNWGNSINENGTPGQKNSISPKLLDIAVTDIIINPVTIKSGDTVSFHAVIKNSGSDTIINGKIKFTVYSDTNSIPAYVSNQIPAPVIAPASAVNINSPYQIKNIQTPYRIIVNAFLTGDEDTSNNIREKIITPTSGIKSGIVINEVMFAPDSPAPEWIELYNNSGNRINLKNWKISDLTSKVTISSSDLFLNPDAFLIISKEAGISAFFDTIPSAILTLSLPSLNNDKDAVILSNDEGITVDSLFYFADWGLTGYSIERIDIAKQTTFKMNWHYSLSGFKGTPGKINSSVNLKSYSEKDLTINEIMYDPLTGLSEYLELKNTTANSINVSGWKIEINSSEKINLTNEIVVPSGGFLLISADSVNLRYFSNIPASYDCKILVLNQTDINLTNDYGTILLKDALGSLIDSVSYTKDWHNPIVAQTKGRSLEKLMPKLSSNDKSNWSTSAGNLGGTPGYENSVHIKNNSSFADFDISPNPFSPDFDGFEDFTVFSYKLPMNSAYIRIKIFDSKGRLIKILKDNDYSSSEGKITFNGFDNNNNPLPIGVYIVLFEAYNTETGESAKFKKALVIARKL